MNAGMIYHVAKEFNACDTKHTLLRVDYNAKLFQSFQNNVKVFLVLLR